jgi:phenylalanyl-tRNA synthetase beta chain
MRVPLSWLADFVPLEGIAVETLAERLVLSTAEVDRVLRRGAPDVAGNHDLFRIGRVVQWQQHPNADRLRLCLVDVGEDAPRQIVCGAANFDTDDTVVVALPGARLPGAAEPLRRAKLRGETSDGMMLSERELELSDENAGIIVLPPVYEIGSHVRDHVALADTILELAPESNRADLLSIYGVAREVAALFDLELAPLPGRLPPVAGTRDTSELVTVAIEAPERCYRFTARGFDDVRVGPSPLAIRQRLAACGMRPLANVVDVTNYVMLGVGQPTHAYDAAKIPGRTLVARLARDGERITTLDSRERVLTADMLVIADGDGPSGIAAVMGAEGSEISEQTTSVVLEAANFERHGVQRACAALGLYTDSARRWMRGVDPHLAPLASAWAAELLVDLAGARMLPGDQDVVAHLPERPRIVLRSGRAERIVGTAIGDDEAVTSLGRLGFEPERVAEGVAATAPTWRWLDTTREIDLVEEVARLHGLDRLPSTLPALAGGGLTAVQRVRRRVEDALAGAGLQEAVTVTLVDQALVDAYLGADDERRAMVGLANPLSAELACMRRTLVPSLLAAARRNRAAGREDVALFEVAHLYHPPPGGVSADHLADEPWTVGAVLAGRLGGTSWNGDGRETDFSCAKGVVEAVAARLGVKLGFAPIAPAHLHPGRAAHVTCAGETIGEVGELHPAVVERFDLEGRVAVFELDLDRLAAAAPARAVYATISKQPPVRQDIAVVVADTVAAADVVEAALATGAPLLVDARVFDVYRDAERLGAGHVSLAVRLTFQDPVRTLTEDEASAVRERVVAALAERFGAALRGPS